MKMDKEKQDIFLYAENVNFSEHSYEDWNQTSFTFFRDGTLKIKKVYGSSVQEDIIQIRKSDYIYTKNLMSSIMNNPPREKVDADDGDAWSFAFLMKKES